MRVLLKISGEYLAGDKQKGYDKDRLDNIVDIVKEILDNGIELGIMVGGGNLIRGNEIEDFSSYSAHNMGFLSSCINAYGLEDYLNKSGIKASSFHPINVLGILNIFNKKSVVKKLEKLEVVIFGGGTGHPYFSTDSGAVLRAIEIEADMLIKATKVDGLYDMDPIKNSEAKFIKEISYDEVLQKNLRVMDQTAIALARDNSMPTKIVSLYKKGDILKAIKGDKVGTTIQV